MALVTDWTDPNFNSYVTEAQADALVTTIGLVRDTSKYLALTAQDKETFLVQATRWIYQFLYKGTERDDLEGKAVFPRSGLTDRHGKTLPDDAVPEDVELSQVTRVLDSLDDLANPQTHRLSSRSDHKKSSQVGRNLKTEWFQSVTRVGSRTLESNTAGTPAFMVLEQFMDEDFLSDYNSGYHRYVDPV